MSASPRAGRSDMVEASRGREAASRRWVAALVGVAVWGAVMILALTAAPSHAQSGGSHLAGPPPLGVPTPTSNTSTLDLGMTLNATLNASNVTGGSGNPANFQYQWFGLPTNCTSRSVWNYSCVPTSTGTFSITVTVNDTVAHRSGTSAKVTVTVNTDPSISSFTVSATSVPVNGSITFTATATGGSLPYALYVYKGLPSGCTGNTSSITCKPGVAQTYNVSVSVVDAVGMASNASSLSVTVTSGASPSTTKGPTPVQWGIIAAILVVGLGVAAFLWMRARKEERTSYAASLRTPPPGVPPPPTSPPGPPPPG